jgi:hypothetical protein
MRGVIDYSALYAAIASGVGAAVPGLHCYDHEPDAPVCPALVLADLEIDSKRTYAGEDSAILHAYALADRTGGASSQHWLLDNAVKNGSAIREALKEASVTLKSAGAAGGLIVTDISGPRQYLFGATWRLGVRFDILIVAA